MSNEQKPNPHSDFLKIERFKIKPGNGVTIKLLDDVQLAPQYWINKEGQVELRSMSIVHDPSKDR